MTKSRHSADWARRISVVLPGRSQLESAPHLGVRWVMLSMLALLGILTVSWFFYVVKAESDKADDVRLVQLVSGRLQTGRDAQTVYQRLVEPSQTASAMEEMQVLASLGESARKQLSQVQTLLTHWHLNHQSDEEQRIYIALEAWAKAELQLEQVQAVLQSDLERDQGRNAAKSIALLVHHMQALTTEISQHAATIREILLAHMLEQGEGGKSTAVIALVTFLGVLLFMALGVVEPTARMVRAQYRDLQSKAQRQRRLMDMADMSPSAMMLADTDNRVLWANQAFSSLIAVTPERCEGRPVVALLRAARIDQVALQRMRNALDKGVSCQHDAYVQLPNAKRRWFQIDLKPHTNEDGAVVGMVLVANEMTELRRQAYMLHLAIDGAGLGVWDWDIGSDWAQCNERFMELMGFDKGSSSSRGAEWLRRVHPDDMATWWQFVRGMLSSDAEPSRCVVRMQQSTGRWVWLLVAGTVSERNHAGWALRATGVVMDVNAQKTMELQLRNAARTDALTQLPNRLVVLEKIEQVLAKQTSQPGFHFAVLFMDFDRFKQVNDTLGHDVGDELLRQIAQRLQSVLRPGDMLLRTSDFELLAARLGGDEFVVVLNDIRGDLDAEIVASRLLDVLAVPYQVGEHRIDSTASIGIVTSSHAAGDAGSVLRDADIAMYEAKRAGRGRYIVFDPEMRDRVGAAVALENDLRQAMANQELFVVYQPIVGLASLDLLGVEALIRWRHPVRGLVSPVEFIPVAESCGLIDALGQFVLLQSCSDFASWQVGLGELAPLTVSVNLSRAQLKSPRLLGDIKDALRQNSIKPGQLILEITESLAAQDGEIQTSLHAIRALGVELSLDDFGTGYSSLACLHELPIQHLKIDRSFVKQARTSHYHHELAESVVHVGHALRLQVVAEGVETQEQLERMRQIGCDKGQGYLFAKPMESKDLLHWVHARSDGEGM